MTTLHLESLEARQVLSTITLTAGTLFVQGDNQDNIVFLQVNPLDPSQIQANVDGQLRTFATAAVQQIVVLGGNGSDILTVNVPAVPTILMGQNGNDNLWTFGSDMLSGGNGSDTLYSIVGASLIDGGNGPDRLIGNTRSLFVNDNPDRPNVVFGSTTLPVQLSNGILYFLGTANADQAVIVEVGNQLRVTYNGLTTNFLRSQVDQVVGILGAGNDMVYNASSADGVFYGAADNDFLVGGSGDDILKGGGGNDFLDGGDGADDLTGDQGADFLVANGRDILRIDAADLFLSTRRDTVFSIAGGP